MMYVLTVSTPEVTLVTVSVVKSAVPSPAPIVFATNTVPGASESAPATNQSVVVPVLLML